MSKSWKSSKKTSAGTKLLETSKQKRKKERKSEADLHIHSPICALIRLFSLWGLKLQ